MIVYVLFVHKNLFQREKFLLFKKKFLDGFFWVGFLLPTLPDVKCLQINAITAWHLSWERSRCHQRKNFEMFLKVFFIGLVNRIPVWVWHLSSGFRIRIHFLRIRIRIQWIRIQSGSRALMTKNWKKITGEKKIKFFFDQNCNLPIPRPP